MRHDCLEALTAADDAYPPLPPAAEARRQKVLAMLARDGGQYACLVEDSNTDPVILALATPDGTCELLIPRDRYDPFRVLELVAGWNRGDPLTVCEGELVDPEDVVVIPRQIETARDAAWTRWLCHEVLPTIRRTGSYQGRPPAWLGSPPDWLGSEFGAVPGGEP